MSATYRIRESGVDRVVAADEITIGRQSGATIVLRDANVSRLHARVTFADGAFRLRDAGSRNGTFVGERRVVDHLLRAGDEIVVGSRLDEQADAPRHHRIRVEIEGSTCALSLLGGHSSETTTSFHALRPFFLAAEGADAAGGAARDAASSAAGELPVVLAPVRGKAVIRAGRWVPTSDLRPHRLRRGLVLALTAAAAVVGAAALRSPRAERLAPGGTTAAHSSVKFVSEAGAAGACGACHTPWRGVDDRACLACHKTETPSPHGPLGLACAGCHREHGRGALAGEPVGRHRCTDCHVRAHASPPAAVAAEGDGAVLLFLNRRFGTALIHSDHDKLECARCHVMGAADEAGQVTSGCEVCHGGGRGIADARCFSCHRYHVRAVPAGTRT